MSEQRKRDMATVESLASDYAAARRELVERVNALQEELDAAQRRHIAGIKQAVMDTAARHSELHALIDDRRDLFEKPKTVVIEGVRVGLRKQKGSVEIDDEERVIKRIRAQVPEDQAELLIRVSERVDKTAVADLSAADLKRLGIRITNDEEVVHIKPTDGDVDKLVKALLADAEGVEGEVL